MATHSSILAWKEKPGRVQLMGSQRVGYNSATEYTHTRISYLDPSCSTWDYHRPQDALQCSGLFFSISFTMDWLDLLAVQGTLKSLLQHHSSKASILRCSAFFTVQLSHPYMTTGKTIALTRRTFVGKVMSLLLNMLSRLVVTFLPSSKRLLISWLQSPSAVIFEPKK